MRTEFSVPVINNGNISFFYLVIKTNIKWKNYLTARATLVSLNKLGSVGPTLCSILEIYIVTNPRRLIFIILMKSRGNLHYIEFLVITCEDIFNLLKYRIDQRLHPHSHLTGFNLEGSNTLRLLQSIFATFLIVFYSCTLGKYQ